MRASRLLGVDVHGLAVLVLALDGDAHVALHGNAQRAEREAAFLLAGHLVRALDDDGIDERARLGILAIGPVHEQPPQQADLIAGEADAVRVVHETGHARDERAQIVGELAHGSRRRAQDRLGVLPDLAARDHLAGTRTGLALDLLLAAPRPSP